MPVININKPVLSNKRMGSVNAKNNERRIGKVIPTQADVKITIIKTLPQF